MPRIFQPSEIAGILPPLLTPLADDETIDVSLLRELSRFMLRQGVHGLVVGGSSGEGFNLSVDELRTMTGVVGEELGEKGPLIAGVIANSTRDAIERARAIADLGVSALQLTPVHYIYKTDEEAMIRHFREVYDAVGIPIIVYNVIPWNYLTPSLLLRMMREEPGVIGVKQSAGDLKLLADLLLDAGPKDRIFAAIDALLYPSIALGAHGVISMLAAAAPRQCLDLWEAVQRGDHATALGLHRKMLRLWNAIFADNRIATSKFALSLQGAPLGISRRPTPAVTPQQQATIRSAVADLTAPIANVA
ncbi:MAG: dihydrodipicolinate synthase family protein [Microvirga sp.]|jgi:4-hydroxy-tetrahydrodipicolinate synthase|nr:dihydrodipicolinate synthase family protein [Microvirga sp.]